LRRDIRDQHIHHGGRAAARVVAAEQRAGQPLHHEGLRGLEHLGLGAAEAVDGLFGVTDNEEVGFGVQSLLTLDLWRSKLYPTSGDVGLPIKEEQYV